MTVAMEEKSLEVTPTWAVAMVCTVFIVASLLVERGLNALGKYLRRREQKELSHTLDVIKNELMLLGFISLLLTVFQPKIASMCMPDKLNRTMLPCSALAYKLPDNADTPAAAAASHAAHSRRRLFKEEQDKEPPVHAPSSSGPGSCAAGHVQIISVEGLHQLHIFIFVMAVVHVLYSCLTVLVGLWQVHSWKKWEVEARNERVRTLEEALKGGKAASTYKPDDGQKFANSRIRYKFLHTSRTGLNLDSYVYSFFRQFGRPIYKADYLCLRLGFIASHELNADYDFHSYIQRTMEEDFKTVVGISTYLWAFVCLFLLLDIDGWYTYFWMAFIPTILVLVVGTKLQQIIIDLALEVRGGVEKIDLSTIIDLDSTEFKAAEKPKQQLDGGVLQPMTLRDGLFWFKKPHVLVHLVHFVLFQNAFELAFFFWAMFEYGFSSCLVGRTWMVVVRLLMGVFVQVLCSASTLPLYALVSQMGSTIRFTVFNSQNAQSAIHGWRAKAAKRVQEKAGHTPLTHHLADVIGFNKHVDEQGHVHGIALSDTHGIHHSKNHDKNTSKGLDHKLPQLLHPKSISHQGDSHTVEIDQEADRSLEEPTPAASSRPLALAHVYKLVADDSSPLLTAIAHDSVPQSPKKSSLSVVYQFMANKEKGQESASSSQS